jgi:ATP-dependent Clp protease adaptor protein ClpS
MQLKKYDVVLLNDNEHSYSYVCCMLDEIFHMSKDQALKMAQDVDTNGEVVLYSGFFEHAEARAKAIEDFGPDIAMPSSTGSMKVELREVN